MSPRFVGSSFNINIFSLSVQLYKPFTKTFDFLKKMKREKLFIMKAFYELFRSFLLEINAVFSYLHFNQKLSYCDCGSTTFGHTLLVHKKPFPFLVHLHLLQPLFLTSLGSHRSTWKLNMLVCLELANSYFLELALISRRLRNGWIAWIPAGLGKQARRVQK